jgi:hypothetical protein
MKEGWKGAHIREIVWAYIGQPEENRTGGHCHKIGKCSGNKMFMITVMWSRMCLSACLAGDNVNNMLCCK